MTIDALSEFSPKTVGWGPAKPPGERLAALVNRHGPASGTAVVLGGGNVVPALAARFSVHAFGAHTCMAEAADSPARFADASLAAVVVHGGPRDAEELRALLRWLGRKLGHDGVAALRLPAWLSRPDFMRRAEVAGLMARFAWHPHPREWTGPAMLLTARARLEIF